MKITREEFKELAEICLAARFMDKDDSINCLVSWISDGLGFTEEDMTGSLLYDMLRGEGAWGFGSFERKMNDVDVIYDLCLKGHSVEV